MRRMPSKRNLAVVAYLDQGHTLQEAAAHFLLEASEVRRIERLTRDYGEAIEALQRDPVDLMLLARAGRLMFPAARALAENGIHQIDQLDGITSRDLLCIPKIGRGAAEQIVKLAAERGIEIKGPLPPRRTVEAAPTHPWLRKRPALSACGAVGAGARNIAQKSAALANRLSPGPARQAGAEGGRLPQPLTKLPVGGLPDTKAKTVVRPGGGPDRRSKAGRGE